MKTIVARLFMTTFGGVRVYFLRKRWLAVGYRVTRRGNLGENFPSTGVAQGDGTGISRGAAVGLGKFRVSSGKTGVAEGNRATRFGSAAVADRKMTTRRRCGRVVTVRIGPRLVGARLAEPNLLAATGCARLAAGYLMTGERCASLAEQARVIGPRCATLAAGNLAPILTITALAEENLMTHFEISCHLEGLQRQILRPLAAGAGGRWPTPNATIDMRLWSLVSNHNGSNLGQKKAEWLT